jgi:hypothetical protein
MIERDDYRLLASIVSIVFGERNGGGEACDAFVSTCWVRDGKMPASY